MLHGFFSVYFKAFLNPYVNDKLFLSRIACVHPKSARKKGKALKWKTGNKFWRKYAFEFNVRVCVCKRK